MKYIKNINLLLFALILLASCTKNEESIQQFYVDNESNEEYLMLDIPISVIDLPAGASSQAKQAYNSINKINLLAFKIKEGNQTNYDLEKAKVNKILKNPSYIELVRLNSNGNKIRAKYIGSEDSAEELILFVSNNQHGFALARVLGDDMKPENMLALLNNINDLDKDSEVFKTIKKFIK